MSQARGRPRDCGYEASGWRWGSGGRGRGRFAGGYCICVLKKCHELFKLVEGGQSSQSLGERQKAGETSAHSGDRRHVGWRERGCEAGIGCNEAGGAGKIQ